LFGPLFYNNNLVRELNKYLYNYAQRIENNCIAGQ